MFDRFRSWEGSLTFEYKYKVTWLNLLGLEVSLSPSPSSSPSSSSSSSSLSCWPRCDYNIHHQLLDRTLEMLPNLVEITCWGRLDHSAALDPVARVGDQTVRVVLAKLLRTSLRTKSIYIDLYIECSTCGGRGKIRVVELFLRATAQPRLWALKLRNCCMKSELSIRAMSAKWRSQRIWFLKRLALLWFGPVRLRPQLLHLRHSSW